MEVTWGSFGHHLGVIRESFGGHLGVIWESFGCHLGLVYRRGPVYRVTIMGRFTMEGRAGPVYRVREKGRFYQGPVLKMGPVYQQKGPV